MKRIALMMVGVAMMLAGCEKKPPDELVELSKRFEPLYGQLQAIARAYPEPSAYQEKPCPKGLRPFRIMAWKLVRTGREKPEELLGPHVSHRGITTDHTLWGPPSDYLKLPENMTEHQTARGTWRRRKRELDEVRGLLEAKHVRAIHVITRMEAMLKGREFASGHIGAWVLTFELDSGKQICAERITVESSDRVIVGQSGAKSSLERDLAKRLAEKLEAHEEAVAPFIAPIH